MGARLVRDRIGDLDWRYPDAKAGLRPVVDRDEHLKLLGRKLLEEVGELLHADTDDEVADEMADVLEVLHALARVVGVHHFTVETRRLDKLAERGGFTAGTVWDA